MKSREHGEIAYFNGSFAFIKPDVEGKDVFAHVSELPTDRIHSGDRVTFDLAPDPYKPGRMRAVQVRFINGDDKAPQNETPG
jgi:cold shock CspA family protein